jgi:hypothetical protein
LLRKKPPKINNGNINGAANPSAASMVGAAIDRNIPEIKNVNNKNKTKIYISLPNPTAIWVVRTKIAAIEKNTETLLFIPTIQYGIVTKINGNKIYFGNLKKKEKIIFKI